MQFQINRRQALQATGMGFGALAAQMFGGLPDIRADDANFNPLLPKQPHFPAKAKHVIHIFANGGPSHIDLFDPKPALEKYAGQAMPGDTPRTERPTGSLMPSPFKFKPRGNSGIEMSELFENLSQHADDMCVIRSMYADVPNHEPSLMLMNTGESRLVRPSVGSWLTYGLGTENQNLPAFVSMCPNGYPIQESQNWQAGFLPGVFQGTYVDTQYEDVERLIQNSKNDFISIDAQRKQLDLVQSLNQAHRAERPQDGLIDSRIRSMEIAFRMQMEASEAFDVTRESRATLDMYGSGVQARQMLIARRLVERGVRFVQLWHGEGQPWDHHDHIESGHRKLAQESDQPIAALITDLKRLGLFDETLILWGGEFGRTPTVELPKEGSNAGTMTGRDHNHFGFSVWMAGGGVKGGQAYGATDEFGFKAVENRMHVHDLHATMLQLMGFDHEKLTYRWSGRDFRLTDVHGRVIHDLIA